MLNYAVERKSEFITELMNNQKIDKPSKEKCLESSMKTVNHSDKSLINYFNNLNINKNTDNEDKENDSNFNNISNMNKLIHHTQSLNLERLKKIDNKSNVKIIFEKLEN